MKGTKPEMQKIKLNKFTLRKQIAAQESQQRQICNNKTLKTENQQTNKRKKSSIVPVAIDLALFSADVSNVTNVEKDRACVGGQRSKTSGTNQTGRNMQALKSRETNCNEAWESR